jgi:hypothetical protein
VYKPLDSEGLTRRRCSETLDPSAQRHIPETQVVSCEKLRSYKFMFVNTEITVAVNVILGCKDTRKCRREGKTRMRA